MRTFLSLILITVFCNRQIACAVSQQLSSPINQVVQYGDSPALSEFLRRFDPIARRGFVKTRRSGSTGVGFTLETLLNIAENNSPRGDLLGMEIKAFRDNEDQLDDHDKMNLFLKEPEWLDGKSSAERIRDYGYIDDNGRPSWYQAVTAKTNSKGLRLVVHRPSKHVQLLRRNTLIGQWTFEVLQSRLEEKLTEVVFVSALSRGSGQNEEFHYQSVTYCRDPLIGELLDLVESGDVILELRMHIKPTGGARNHGTAFRIRKHRLQDLYSVRSRCYSVVQAEAARTPN